MRRTDVEKHHAAQWGGVLRKTCVGPEERSNTGCRRLQGEVILNLALKNHHHVERGVCIGGIRCEI